MCHQTPLEGIVPPKGPAKLYAKVQPEDVRAIVLESFRPKGLVRRIGRAVGDLLDKLASDEVGDRVARHSIDARDGPVCAFLGRQRHIATEFCGTSITSFRSATIARSSWRST